MIVLLLLRFHLDIPTALPKLRSLRWRDFLVIPLTILLLVLTGTVIQKIYYRYTGFSGPLFQIEGPRTACEWSILIFTTFAGAYGEEFFFRLYLLECWGRPNFFSSPMMKEKILSGHFLSPLPRRGIFPFSWHRLPWGPFIVSSVLFALTHLYQGPLGFFQALGAGLILALVYLQTGSVHPPALAHGIFNLLVYLWSYFS